MDGSELPLLVPVSAFADYIQCSICMTQMRQTHMTPCGHRYCENCIKEWVDRQHKCPCCNQPVQVTQLIKDHQFDGLIGAVLVERDKSETRYFETLINQATSRFVHVDGDTSRTPVEGVLKKHLLHSLAAHEKFCQDLKQDFSRQQSMLQEETTKSVSELHSHGLSHEEVHLQTDDLQSTLEKQKDRLTQELNASLELVASAYDKYLSNHIPSLEILPVKVSINLLEKNIKLSDVLLRPKDSLCDIQALIDSAMEEKGDKILSWGGDVRFLIFGPFCKGSNWEMRPIIQEVLELGGINHPGVSVMHEGVLSVVHYSIKPGSELVVWGTVKFESDLPKQCFVNIFREGEGKAVDYFSCKQCRFNWVCRSCMEVCHQGHNIVPYIMNHQPTWACCYCPKKKTCVIQEVK